MLQSQAVARRPRLTGALLTRAGAGALAALGAAIAFSSASTAWAAQARRSTFGVMPDGRAVEAITLSNGHGVTARIITLGASIQSLETPDRSGRSGDIVLGYDTLDGYLKKPNFFGATVGRYANRIAKGRFTLEGRTYQLPLNDGPNSLHGGDKGFDKVLWSVVSVKSGPSASVSLRYVSPDGDEGYPGTLTATVTYSLDEHNDLSIDYRARTDKPTIVNLSNHSYWNLSADAPHGVMNQRLTLYANAFTPIDSTLIPTGEIRPVAGTVFDFRKPKPIGRDIRDGHEPQLVYAKGYDHNWVVSRAPVAKPRPMARVEDPDSGRVLEIWSNQPGIQFYSGNFLDGTIVGKHGRIYRQGDALVLEPQVFPDTPNHPEFGSARLDPGQEYRNLIIYKLSVMGGGPSQR